MNFLDTTHHEHSSKTAHTLKFPNIANSETSNNTRHSLSMPNSELLLGTPRNGPRSTYNNNTNEAMTPGSWLSRDSFNHSDRFSTQSTSPILNQSNYTRPSHSFDPISNLRILPFSNSTPTAVNSPVPFLSSSVSIILE